MTALCAGGPTQQVAQGLLIGGALSVTLPSSVKINGNCAVDGTLVNSATIDGNVTSSGMVFDLLHRITGTITSLAPATAEPSITWNQFSSYTLFGATCTAASEKVDDFVSNDPCSNGNTITAGNPGGVAVLAPISKVSGARIRFHDHTHFQGTVVVNGDVEIDGTDITFTAVNGFPSLVVSGHVYVDAGTASTFNGLVVAHQGFTGGSSTSKTTINGGLMSDTQGYASSMAGTNVINYNGQQSKVYNFSSTTGAPVVEITVWGS
jgi:cytoskeletal protein CcmA (bactofilin family)